MNTNSVKRFSDFAKEDINLSGDKMQMRDIFGKEILVPFLE